MTGSAGAPAKKMPLRFPGVDPDTEDPVVAPIFGAMKARKSGPLNIHRAIAHAPSVYQAFSGLASALREPGATSRADRELAILRTVQIKQAKYEFIQHKRIGLSVGLTNRQIADLGSWSVSDAYTPRQRQILTLTDGVVGGEGFPAETADALTRSFSPQELVELTMVSAFYVAVGQFTHAIFIEPETDASSYGE